MDRKRCRDETSSDDSYEDDHKRRHKRSKKVKKQRRDEDRRRRRRRHRRISNSRSDDSDENSEGGDSDRRPQPKKTTGEEAELSEDVLAAIGKRTFEERTLAPPLHSEFLSRCKDVVEYGLPDEERANLTKKYPPPSNCLFFDPPKLNAEMKRILQPASQTKDARIVTKQQKIAAALAAVTKGQMSLIRDGKDLIDLPIIECLSDTTRLLADIHRNESMIRRSLIMANINPTIKEAVQETTCNEWLFREKLDEVVKSAKTFDSTAQSLRPGKNASNRASKNSNNRPVNDGRTVNRGRRAGTAQTSQTRKRATTPIVTHDRRNNERTRAIATDDNGKLQILNDLLRKSSICKCKPVRGQFVSGIFLRPKSDGSKRLILNLVQLNSFIPKIHFKIEDVKIVKRLITNGDYMATLDLKDAYYLIPIHNSSKIYLSFQFDNQLYQFECLPFGLSVARYEAHMKIV
ncbi:hypothetical protein TSAR_009849 [Trichomalopsis sarcophagae]|uniref:Reverse transcriptase domain-containing protein n=1 Tax=Trichomalopsis sarcophagae TaxID=543379 RepID=A0A232ERM5_9HYME|nr:hypothetical protein TSAR_009849 [Trichomalopsis sarcophagae]